MNKTKKWVLALLIPLLIGGALAGVYFILRANREPAKVYPVAEISEEMYDDYQNMVGGEVRTDRLQTAFVSQTQEITDILISEGQEVKKGEVLVRFNTTLTQLQLQRKEIAIKQTEEELEKNQRTYQKLFGKRFQLASPQEIQAGRDMLDRLARGWVPGSADLVLLSNRSPVDPVTEPTEPVTEPTEPVTEPTEPVTEPTEPVTEPTEPVTEPTEPVTEPTEPVTEPTEPVTEPTEPVTEPTESSEPTEPTEPLDPDYVPELALVAGTGTPEDPELYVLNSGYSLTPELLAELLGERETLDLILANTEEDRKSGLVLTAWGMSLSRKDGVLHLQLLDGTQYIGQPLIPVEPEPEPDFPDIPEPWIPDVPSGPSWQELQEMRKELEQTMRDLDLQLRMDRVEYKSMEAELGDGTIRAEFDGVILSLNDPDYAFESGEPLFKLSGGGGYTVVCDVSELQLAWIQPGQTVTVNSWMGGQYEATVTEISPYPASNQWGDPNQNLSYYPVSLEVDASADMGDGYWVDVNLGGGNRQRGGFYLFKAFVLTENGKSYVMVRNEAGLLERRYLSTGRDMYGYSIEILGGLDRDAWIAFPYAKSAQEGAQTQEGQVSELWGR